LKNQIKRYVWKETQIKEWRLQPNTEQEREREREREEYLQQNEVKRARSGIYGRCKVVPKMSFEL
jgi:hypothetical protein